MHICRAFLTLCVLVPDCTQYGSTVDCTAYHIHTMHYDLFSGCLCTMESRESHVDVDDIDSDGLGDAPSHSQAVVVTDTGTSGSGNLRIFARWQHLCPGIIMMMLILEASLKTLT